MKLFSMMQFPPPQFERQHQSYHTIR
jgi:hypothetical protein